MNKQLATLAKRGPHPVLIGDLSYAGFNGKVYTPAAGTGLPAVAFGHDWRKDIKHYHATLRHLASWGIVVVAPNTVRGVFPQHRHLAADLESALQIAAGVKLGEGNITVSTSKLGLVGHGMGAGCAILAAANNDKVKAVAAAYPAHTAPDPVVAATRVSATGLILGSGKEDLFVAGNPAKIAHNWQGEVIYRELTAGTQAGFSAPTLTKLLLGTGCQTSATETARGLITGFLLHTLAGDKQYHAFCAADAKAKQVTSYSGDELRERAHIFQ